MRSMRIVVVIGVALYALSCAPFRVSYDYDTSADFSLYTTYAWREIPRTVEMNDLVVGRIKDAVNRELQDRGFSEVPELPDFFITAQMLTRHKVELVDWGYGPGPYWYGGPYGYPRFSSREYEEGVLIIDFVDAEKNTLIWRGAATGIVEPALRPEQRTETISRAVARILEKFPPVQ
jgi:hypothetical protein